MIKRAKLLRFTFPIVLILLLIVIKVEVIEANSLWNDSSSLFSDNKAGGEGDLLTIIISEDTSATQQANTDSSQGTDVNVGAGNGILDFITAFGVNQSDSATAAGSTTRSGTLSSNLTVEVIQVLDNGNLKVGGEKRVTVNDETQKVTLTGIVRPQDITPQNTIDSTYVANVNIEYDGKGVVGDRQRPGIITRILNWFF